MDYKKINPFAVWQPCLSRTVLQLAITTVCACSGCTQSEGNIKENVSSERPEDKKEKTTGFKTNIEKSTLENENFRAVLYTTAHNQLVLMSLLPNEEIGEEIHTENDQFFRFEAGKGKCIIEDTEYTVQDGDVIIIPAGAKHNIINIDSKTALKMYTIYSPPHHKDGIVKKTKEEAEMNEEEFDGTTSDNR